MEMRRRQVRRWRLGKPLLRIEFLILTRRFPIKYSIFADIGDDGLDAAIESICVPGKLPIVYNSSSFPVVLAIATSNHVLFIKASRGDATENPLAHPDCAP
jgi:hypothetical protein